MHRSIRISSLFISISLGLTASSIASADDEGAPAEEAPVVRERVPARRTHRTYETYEEGSGFVLGLTPGMLVVPGGKLFDGGSAADMSGFGPGLGGELSGAYYFTPNVGLKLGLRYTFDHKGLEGCQGLGSSTGNSSCNGSTFQLPVTVQYALQNRKRGLYLEGGIGLLTSYSMGVSQGDATEQLTFHNDFLEGKLGGGYRIPFTQKDGPSRFGADIFAQADFGQFNMMTLSQTGAASQTADVDQKAFHYMVAIGVALHVTP
jgi:hypothetical protein